MWNNVWLRQFESKIKIMKATITLFAFVLLITLGSCYTDTVIGPSGPVGPTGPKGADGQSGFVFEWENVNFTAPNYEVILPFPDNFEGLDSDVALVYLLWDSYTNDNNEVVEVWRQLSQTILRPEGALIYNADFSKYDARLFLEAQFSLDDLTANATDNWIVRVVVVPGDFWNSGRVDFSDYNLLEEILGLPKLPGGRKTIQRN
ncbi:MAG: hypothetical protein ACI8TA_003533 [Cyclobacteriaceae bacterium]|jgi:hypothetical protein